MLAVEAVRQFVRRALNERRVQAGPLDHQLQEAAEALQGLVVQLRGPSAQREAVEELRGLDQSLPFPT